MKSTESIDGLELISHAPRRLTHPVPLVFVHGAFVAAWCWDEYFLPYFARQGFAAHALSLRGHGASDGWESLASASIEDYEADVLRIVRHVGEPVILIGHSMGGMVVQRCLRRTHAAAAVLMASVPPEGLMGSSFLLAARDPALLRELNLIQYAHPGFATAEGLRRAVFSERIAADDLARHFTRMQPESQRAVFDLAWPQHLFIGGADGLPVLVLGGERDAFFPPQLVDSTARTYRVAPRIFPAMAHAMMLEPDWRPVADAIVAWLGEIGM